MTAYFDTSAIIKLLLSEEGSGLAAEIWRRARTAVSNRLAYPEARAALAQARRSGRIGAADLRAAVADLDGALRSMRLVGVDLPLARKAGELAERHALRGCDAVHLASALALPDEAVVLVSWDPTLAGAAQREDCATAPVL